MSGVFFNWLSLFRGILIFLSYPFFLSTTCAQSDPITNQIKEAESHWGLSPLKPQLRHHLEGASLVTEDTGFKILELRVWFEDSSVTNADKSGAPLFCRIAHSLVFGRNRLRSKGDKLPIARAFSSIQDAKAVRLVFFAVKYRNRPNTGQTSPQKTALRVVWTREEQIIPYLSLTISRPEWESLSSIVKAAKDVTFETFKENFCEPFLKLTPNLKANFSALAPLTPADSTEPLRESQ